MIIITGSMTAKADHRSDLLALCQKHVAHSRTEPGCLLHRVTIDSENPNMFVFIEYWQDMDAVKAHFALETSRAFVKNAGPWVAEPPEMTLFEAAEIIRP